ncbi:tyrosine-type recombinase/integrase [Pseudomonas aeruginosa]|jgi:integrase|uniref:tyrosine-type recombinase/integrase n=1 Tax=Pseudomonas aeruginosa TaxID=287 RepID=UPI00053DBAD2|nr:site-specific integrase [Pseudomonas aeruginosa]AYK23080.1 site-specific integrase [Pseudomonas aeruginosa]EKX2113008.1 integrase arm-type DNA-binding domain-containing protein [Pseudomonas aeruginosa]EKY4187243.1 integrase arm-type DNA-binding domain-containing protein [Pseudomonas aeruginosa]ELL1259035.1 integrase arm-type DNA-binding domain-containing protein [Pseudomonas aeruginosa]ELT3988967.1 integrase arm-type DNA-binding domain-containing protein [Pseudomonas aeruginosa]
MGSLTVKTVEKLIKAGTPGTTGDGDGLYLQVARNGSPSWLYRFQLNGKRRNMGLGSCDLVTLAEAREKAAEARKLAAAGIDPIEDRKEKEGAAKAASVTFDNCASDYIAAHRPGWKNAKHAQQWENTLATYATPIIGKLAPQDITTAHILEVLKPIWSAKPETASRLRNRIELILDAAKARNLRHGENPARWRGHLDKLLPKRTKVRAVVHHPALPWAEIPKFMAGLAEHRDLTYAAMRLTILTACRTSEVLAATWDEIDDGARTWTIPGARMKSGKEHRVPLSDPAFGILTNLPRIDGSPYLFPSTRKGKHLSNMAMLMGLRRMERDDLTMHGFRSSFRDWAAECTPHPNFVVEMALAHVVGNAVEAAYRRGDLFEKRRQLMEDWAHYCDKPTGNDRSSENKEALSDIE